MRTPTMRGRKRPILLVEDDIVDVKTVRRAFEHHEIANPLHVAKDGAHALAFLRREGEYADAEHPAIILLDLNLPVMNGIEFLRVAKSDEQIKKLPVVVLTTSHEESDIVESYRLGVAGYIVKPVDFGKFLHAVRVFDLYWALSELPVGQ